MKSQLSLEKKLSTYDS